MTATFTVPTLANIRGRVRFYIDEPLQANFTDADINYAINDAQQAVVSDITQISEDYFVSTTPTIITPVANTQFYPLPADFYKMIFMYDQITGLPINFTTVQNQNQVSTAAIQNVNAGYAYNAVIVGNSVGFVPTPTATNFSPAYFYSPMAPDMLADGDTSIIPRNFIDLVAIQAAIDCKIKDEDDTTALERKYAASWNKLTKNLTDRQQANNRRVQRTASPNVLGM